MTRCIICIKVLFQVVKNIKFTSTESFIHLQSSFKYHLLFSFLAFRICFGHTLFITINLQISFRNSTIYIRRIIDLMKHIHFSLILFMNFLLLIINFRLNLTLHFTLSWINRGIKIVYIAIFYIIILHGIRISSTYYSIFYNLTIEIITCRHVIYINRVWICLVLNRIMTRSSCIWISLRRFMH